MSRARDLRHRHVPRRRRRRHHRPGRAVRDRHPRDPWRRDHGVRQRPRHPQAVVVRRPHPARRDVPGLRGRALDLRRGHGRRRRPGSRLVHDFGVQKGDRVSIGMRNYPEWICAIAAITSIGAISVSLNAWWTEDEIDFALRDSGTSVLIADIERVERAAATMADTRHPGPRRPGRRARPARRRRALRRVGRPHEADARGRGRAPTTTPPSSTRRAPPAGRRGRCRPTGRSSSRCSASPAEGAVDRLRKPVDDGRQPGGPLCFILAVPLFHVTGCVPVMMSDVRGRHQVGDHVQVGSREGARAHRDRAGHQLRGCAHHVVGSARVTRLRRRGTPRRC